jgi:hypothetical protein
MKVLKPLILLTVLLSFVACDDDWTMDLTPPRGGWLWVVNNDLPGGASDDSVIWKLDLPSGRWLDWVDAPFRRERNRGLAYGDGKVWVGGYDVDEDTGDRQGYYCGIDVETGERDPWVEVWPIPYSMAWDGEYLWFVAGHNFFRIDVVTGTYEMRFTTTVYLGEGLAYDGSYFWGLSRPDKLISKVEPETGKVLRRIPAPGDRPVGLAWDGEALWVNDEFENIVYRVDPDNGNVLGYFSYNFEGYKWGLAFEFPSE